MECLTTWVSTQQTLKGSLDWRVQFRFSSPPWSHCSMRALHALCNLLLHSSLCVLRTWCQAGHNHSCSQLLPLVQRPHCCIICIYFNGSGGRWNVENTCAHLSGNARIGSRAVPQAGKAFPNLRPEEKHFVQEPKWVVVNKAALLLLLGASPILNVNGSFTTTTSICLWHHRYRMSQYFSLPPGVIILNHNTGRAARWCPFPSVSVFFFHQI